MSKILPVILSGGVGTRLWPASRSDYPKQLLPLAGSRSLLQQTAMRIDGIDDIADSLLVICNETHRFLVAEQLRSIGQRARIVLEPEGRNTAPAVALAALVALSDCESSDAPVLLVMPADHVIHDKDAFAEALSIAKGAAATGDLVTFGIKPTAVETGYGYIQAKAQPGSVARVQSFVEKPDAVTAQRLLQSGEHFWNSGIFMFRADSFLDELDKFAPGIVGACKASLEQATDDADFLRPDAAKFKASPSDSVDYAVMEHTDRAAMVPFDGGWSDVGSWSALHDIVEQDSAGNSLTGDVVVEDCQSSYVRASNRLVAVAGLKNVVVVEDKDAVLVVSKDRSQDVKTLVEQLIVQGRAEPHQHRRTFTAWGSAERLDFDDSTSMTVLIIDPGAEYPIAELQNSGCLWTIVRGELTVTSSGNEQCHPASAQLALQPEAVQRLLNNTDSPLHVIAISTG